MRGAARAHWQGLPAQGHWGTPGEKYSFRHICCRDTFYVCTCVWLRCETLNVAHMCGRCESVALFFKLNQTRRVPVLNISTDVIPSEVKGCML